MQRVFITTHWYGYSGQLNYIHNFTPYLHKINFNILNITYQAVYFLHSS